ncbi:protein ASYMMETRIC LEAVES 2-like [Impatiens glandulifera]|uniref:protein ASYMMETRIC LEAVES 2-like n=1 Tax=Impatiens glandulifera TaxID=253017 RepID=UPI001FB19C9E|nr:protein ASYMMETRIC LEAVES 2-like [Impatiens glandulifera]
MSSSPCAACKFLRRKCTHECVFAPYFPPDNPQKFANVHRVFGASNVSKLLSELHASQREEAVNSLSYEAEFRLRDPVYGCVGIISVLQHRLSKIQYDLAMARGELAGYIGSSALIPNLSSHPPNDLQQQHSNNLSHASSVFPGGPGPGPHMSQHHHHHQLIGGMQQQPDGQQLMVQMHDQPLLDLGNSHQQHHHHDGVYQFQQQQQPELLLQHQSAPEDHHHHQQQRQPPKLELKPSTEEGLSADHPFC